MKRISILTILLFLVAGCASAVDLVFYSMSNVQPPGQPYKFDTVITAGNVETLPISCDCTMTTISGDPYSGFSSTSFTFHEVNGMSSFVVGALQPGGLIVGCSEPISVESTSNTVDTIDLSTGIDLQGIANNIDINWIYVGLAGGFTVYNRGDGWQTWCDGVQLEINARKSPAPC
jgi:hypothetical protein